jgi:type I restriction enzyme S subunit
MSDHKHQYEMLPLSEVATINPDTYSPKENWTYVNYLDTSSITDGSISEVQHIIPASEKLPSRARRKIATNDIVFSTVRPNQRHFGLIKEPMTNMLASTGFAVIRSNTPRICNELIYLCVTDNGFVEKMQQLAEQSTSTFPSIKPNDLESCEIPCPIGDTSTNLTEMLKSVFNLISANQQENKRLSDLRDTLLPKLMSGELDVSNLDI